MEKKILKAEVRKILGRKVKQLRRKSLIPANVYGKKTKSLAIAVSGEEFKKLYKEVGETGLIELQIKAGESKPVLVHNIQFEPVYGQVLHIDFLQVDLKEKVTAKVPIEVLGESPAEKQGLGTVVLQLDEIEVEALPADLPEKFGLDVACLTEVDQAIYVKDLKVDEKKVKIIDGPAEIVIKVEPLQKEEVAPAAAPAEEEVAVEGAAEGEKAAEEAKENQATPTAPKEAEAVATPKN